MLLMKLREVKTGDFVLVNGDQVARVTSQVNDTRSPVVSSRLLVLEMAGSTQPELYVPVDDQGDFAPHVSDHDTVLRYFLAFEKNLRRNQRPS